MIQVVSLLLTLLATLTVRAEFRAGAFAQDISPTTSPAPVNVGMQGN